MTGISFETESPDIASRAVHVTVAAEHLQQAERKALRQYARAVRIPGFRKGHAPEPVIRKRFDEEISRHVLESAMRESWEQISAGLEAPVIDSPEIQNVNYDRGKLLTFDMVVGVRPEIQLSNVSGFTVVRRVASVTDQQVEDRLQQLREQRATWSPVTDSKPKPGNLVSVTVTSLEAGNVSAGEPHELVLGQGQTIPDVEERIMSLSPGETVDAEVRFPADHPDESRRGQTRRVRITLHEVKQQSLPAADDAFARELGDFDSLEALRSAVRSDLEQEASRTADEEIRTELLRRVAEANGLVAPPSLVRRRIRRMVEAYEIPPAQVDTFSQTLKPVAEAQTNRELVIDSIASAQNLRATEADVDARVARMAAARAVEPGKLYASLQKNQRLAELYHAITEEKVFDWLLQQSTVTEEPA